jgi:mono/diheme cytochrome c family protein
MRTFVSLSIAAAFVLVGAAAPGAAGQADQAAKIEAGKKLYDAQKCRTCHIIGGVGSKAASALDGVGSKLSEADLRMWLTDPAAMTAKLKAKPKVAMKKVTLKDPEIDALVAYMASLKK